jgi:hypothetical protein
LAEVGTVKLTGKIVDASVDFVTGITKVTLAVNEKNDFLQGYDDLKALEKLSIELKPYRAKRSLDANAYAWVLIDKIAENQSVSKEEVYREAIKSIGGNSEIVCVQNEAVERLCEGWRRNGIGWQTETFPSKLDGCTNVMLFYGSSVYDSKQMSLLLDNIIQDCKALGIQTETPESIEKMKSLWEQK